MAGENVNKTLAGFKWASKRPLTPKKMETMAEFHFVVMQLNHQNVVVMQLVHALMHALWATVVQSLKWNGFCGYVASNIWTVIWLNRIYNNKEMETHENYTIYISPWCVMWCRNRKPIPNLQCISVTMEIITIFVLFQISTESVSLMNISRINFQTTVNNARAIHIRKSRMLYTYF